MTGVAATPEPQTPGVGFQIPAVAVPEFSPITVHIVYSLRNPVDGFQFVIPTEAYPYVSLTPFRLVQTYLFCSVPHMLTQHPPHLMLQDAGYLV
jgi:hypothetical protein